MVLGTGYLGTGPVGLMCCTVPLGLVSLFLPSSFKTTRLGIMFNEGYDTPFTTMTTIFGRVLRVLLQNPK